MGERVCIYGLLVVVGLCSTSQAGVGVFEEPMVRSIDENQIAPDGDNLKWSRLFMPGVTRVYGPSETYSGYKASIDFSDDKVIRLTDPLSLGPESAHFGVRSYATHVSFLVDLTLTIWNPNDEFLEFTATDILPGSLDTARLTPTEYEYLDPLGGAFNVSHIDALFEVTAGQVKLDSLNIGLDARLVQIVPEPTALSLLLLAVPAALRRRR